MALWTTVAKAIAAATGRPYAIRRLGPLQGGRASHAYVVSDGDTPYFVKTLGTERGHARAFAWESRSLAAIAAAGAQTPAVIATGRHGTRAFIVLEYIAPAPPPAADALARALLRIHGTIGPDYGADAPGWAGFDGVDNTPAASWAEFWCERRLLPRLAGRSAVPAWDSARARIEALVPVIRDGLAEHQPRPALLHGDLQSPNWMGGQDGAAVLIDAATWFGDPDVDLAGLSVGPPAAREALAAYVRLAPPAAGHEWRIAVYRLWYLLQCHPGQAESLLAESLSRIAQGPRESSAPLPRAAGAV